MVCYQCVDVEPVALRNAGWRLWLLLLILLDWNLMGEKLWNLFPIPRPISCWDPTVTPCERALETKQEYKRVLQCSFALLTCTVFTGGKKHPRLLLEQNQNPQVCTRLSLLAAVVLYCFFVFLGPLWISHSKMKEKISRLPQTTAFLCHCPLSFSFILHIYKNVTAVRRFLIQVKRVPWILYLNWKGIDHFLCFHRGPDPKLEEEHSSSHQLRSVCDRHRAGFLHAVGTVDFPFCYFPLSKDMEFIPGDFLKLFIQLYPDQIQLPPA